MKKTTLPIEILTPKEIKWTLMFILGGILIIVICILAIFTQDKTVYNPVISPSPQRSEKEFPTKEPKGNKVYEEFRSKQGWV